jgi:hypothetical protein
MNDITSSCGGKRRGCCIIELPHDEQPTDVAAGSTPERRLFLVSGLSAGRPSTWAVVSITDSEAAHLVGEATW